MGRRASYDVFGHHECMYCNEEKKKIKKVDPLTLSEYTDYEPLQQLQTKRGGIIYFHKSCLIEENKKNLRRRNQCTN